MDRNHHEEISLAEEMIAEGCPQFRGLAEMRAHRRQLNTTDDPERVNSSDDPECEASR